MESVLYNISQVLGITIIHSLWQGLLIYIVLRTVFAATPSLSALKKYNLAIAAMAAVSVWFIYTLYSEAHAYSWVNLKAVQVSALLPYLNLPTHTHYQSSFYYAIAGYLPYICALYFAGLLVNLGKLGWEWNKIRQIKQSLICAEQMQQFINSFRKKLNITKHIKIKFSELVDVPCMIGFFKPMILLPVSLSVHLSACEIEAILLHELSHIKRNDYLINLLQQFITVLLFFNPFTQLINRIINRERENSCDDLVIEKTGKPVIYARALLKLEEARKTNLQLALAVTGKKFHLLNRIERIMNTKKNIGNIRHLLIALFLLTGSISCIAWLNPKTAGAEATAKKIASNTNTNPSLYIKPIVYPVKPYPVAEMTTVALPALDDSVKYTLLNDTLKHKNKIAAKKVAGKTKNSTSIVFNRDHNRVDTDSIKSFYSSAAWRAQMEMIRKQGEEMRKKFNSPEWKNQMAAIRKQGEEMSKKFNSPEWKAQMEAMAKQGDEMRKQFDSPEWKKQMEDMQKQGSEIQKQFNNPEWKKQMEDIRKQGEEMRKKFDSPEWKKQMENMKKQGEDMQKKFNSPEWKKQMEDIQKQGTEMQKKFNTPEWKKQMEDMQKLGMDMQKNFNSPEWKKQMEDMQKQGMDMQKSFNSPEWKKQMKDIQKQAEGIQKQFGKDQKWILKDSVGGVKIYQPKKAKKDSL